MERFGPATTLVSLALIVACSGLNGAGDAQEAANTEPPSTSVPASGTDDLFSAAVIADGTELRAVNPFTGEAIPGYRGISLGTAGWGPFAMTEGLLVAAHAQGEISEPWAAGTATRPEQDALLLVDRSTWEHQTVALPLEGWVGEMAVSPDGNHLAVTYHRHPRDGVLVFDLSSGRQLGTRELGVRPTLLSFTRDGAVVLRG